MIYIFVGAEIWLDWLKDEIRLTEDESDREKVYELFERAVKDYVCKWDMTVLYSLKHAIVISQYS